MFYGIEQSTDLRYPCTVVKMFSCEKKLRMWMEGGGGFTYPNPDAAKNYHKSFRRGYKYSGRINKKSEIFKDYGSRTYPRNEMDSLATYIHTYGDRIKNKE